MHGNKNCSALLQHDSSKRNECKVASTPCEKTPSAGTKEVCMLLHRTFKESFPGVIHIDHWEGTWEIKAHLLFNGKRYTFFPILHLKNKSKQQKSSLAGSLLNIGPDPSGQEHSHKALSTGPCCVLPREGCRAQRHRNWTKCNVYTYPDSPFSLIPATYDLPKSILTLVAEKQDLNKRKSGRERTDRTRQVPYFSSRIANIT